MSRHGLAIAASAVAVAALVLGVAALSRLDSTRRDDFYGEVAKLSYQAIAIVVLGGLLKRALDEARERDTRRERDNERRAGYIHRVIDASHTVELARTFIWANRSVLTWDKQMHEIVRSYVDLRDVRHEVVTASSADQHLFANWDEVRGHLIEMEADLSALIEEYGQHKKDLSELQRRAEIDRELQDEVWERLQQLDRLGPFLEGSGYGPFRAHYQHALAAMRSQLTGRRR